MHQQHLRQFWLSTRTRWSLQTCLWNSKEWKRAATRTPSGIWTLHDSPTSTWWSSGQRRYQDSWCLAQHKLVARRWESSNRRHWSWFQDDHSPQVYERGDSWNILEAGLSFPSDISNVCAQRIGTATQSDQFAPWTATMLWQHCYLGQLNPWRNLMLSLS
jgi:hypothetical protein